MAKVICSGMGIELHGKAGNAVFAQTRFGLVLRPRTMPKNPRTAPQVAARARLARVSALWRTLTPEQRAEWEAAALRDTRYSRFGGPPRHPAPLALFIALGSKYLQVNPAGTLPLNPPAYPFFGDGITITATDGAGQITFTATGPNAANVVTEMLLQPLPHANRAPKANLYRPKLFAAFAPGVLTRAVSATPGWYAPAYRFVNAATGQATALAPLPAVESA